MEKQTLILKILEQFGKNEPAVLCSIVAASGSSPRGAGAMMAVFADGSIAGTVGGGAVEQQAVVLAAEILKTGRSQQKGYCLSPNEIVDIGMICGGAVTIQFERLEPNEKNTELLQTLLKAIEEPRAAWLIRKIEDGAVSETAVYDEKRGLLFAQSMQETEILPLLSETAVFDGRYAAEPMSFAGTVFVFGGGHVGTALVPVLSACGFHVTVYDNREAVAKKENFPAAKRVVFGSYDRIFEHISITPADAVVILTPGHLGDRAVLLQAMRTDAAYVGCIGSRSKIAATNAFLVENGIAEADLKRIHAPIGLAIGAKTPEEIAVSIAAELIAHRAERRKEISHEI